MAIRDRRLVDAAAALIFGKRDSRRHLILRHPAEFQRARHALLLEERRRRRTGPGSRR